MTYSIERIATLIGARRYGNAEGTIGWLLTDSRSLCFPEQTLFFAIRTQRNDGHRYIGELYRRGVRNFVISEEYRVKSEALDLFTLHSSLKKDCNFLVVPSPLAALQRLAERHRDEFDIPVVGITGSNGKTWVKEWLYQLLSGVAQASEECRVDSDPSVECRVDSVEFATALERSAEGTAVANSKLYTLNSTLKTLKVTRSPRSYNSQIGVPLSVWLLNEQTRVALFEAGISQPGEMMALHDIIQPTIGILTSLGAAHQENFRSMDEKCMEKLQLFHDAQVIIYPSDDDVVSRCIRRSDFKGERIGWSRFSEKAPMYISAISGSNPLHIEYVYKGTKGSYDLPYIDEASIENSITCVTAALCLGLEPEVIACRTPHLEPIAMRLEVKEGQHGLTLINDSYNNDLQSLDIALDFMNRRAENFKNDKPQIANRKSQFKKTLILSDIYQSGEQPAVLYRQASDMAMKRGVGKFIGIGPEISTYAPAYFAGEKHFFGSTDEFLQSSVFRSLHDEVVLLKGARRFGFEHISEQLEQKVHETILEVDLNAVVHNLNYYRSLMKPETKLVCMIKADAYGAGAVELAKTLQEHRVDYLAVAVADEGVALRRAGITQNIIVMNPEMSSFKTLFDYDLEPEVYSFRLMDALIRAARAQGITGWPVHIKLDTGMHRLGFNDSQIAELVDRLKRQSAIIPRSVFSHFVGSDSYDFDNFSARQFQLFDAASRQLQAAFSHKILRHIDNSAGIEHFPDRQLDMCRLGIGLYGVEPLSEECRVKSDSSVECRVDSLEFATAHDASAEGSAVANSKLYTLNSTLKGSAVANSKLYTLNSTLKPLKCVSTLKTTILQIRDVPKEDTVGYSRKGILTRDSRIAAIPIGYADGLDRHLGNRHGYCIVNGQRAEYVGNICMDVALIDVTDIPCQEGDSVEIFGRQLPVTVLSDILQTIPYEVLTSVSNRVKRVYFKD